MATLSFNVAYGTTLEAASSAEVSSTIYAEDINLCQECIDLKNSCFACLTTEQQVFSDSGLTTIVADGYYRHPYNETETNPTWHIVDGYPQGEGFHN